MEDEASGSFDCSCNRRSFLRFASITPLMGVLGGSLLTANVLAKTLTSAKRDPMTPEEIIEMMKAGNERFRLGKNHAHNYLTEQREVSAHGQYPAAIILSCMDSRAPAETIMDLGIGDIFNTRIAGNVTNPDIIGSMEYACKVAGSKVILVMGHTQCGAIKGAIDKVELGHLTGLLTKIEPAVLSTHYSGERSSKNYEFVNAVARTHVAMTVEEIKRGSPLLDDLNKKGSIKIIGSLYDINSGILSFLTPK